MLAKRIIPCLDVTGGRVVKGVHFVNLRDAGDPVELADRYNRDGADELVFLDITASSDAREIMADVVARTARKVFIPLAVGGGIRSVADARRILMSGADKVSVNTAAVRRPELITELSAGIRRAGGGAGHRRAAPRRPADGTSTRAAAATTKASTPWLGGARRSAGRGRNPAHLHGYRWRAGRLRLRAHARRFARHPHSRDRQRRRRQARTFRARADRRLRRRRAGRLHLPLRHLHRQPVEGRAGPTRHPGEGRPA